MNLIAKCVITSALMAIIITISENVFSQKKLSTKFDTVENHNSFYVYKLITNLVALADTQKIYPKHFQISLPQKMKKYRTSGLNQFAFYYPKGQCIFIHIELRDEVQVDTSYSPVEKEIEDVIFKKVGNTWSLRDNNMQINIPNNKRKSEIIKKGAATILLYNILPNRFELFKNNANQFVFNKEMF